MRDLVKQPLTAAELEALAEHSGGPEALVAPKQRAAAEGMSGKKLLAWLAEDGKRVRRPIVQIGDTITLGFTDPVRAELEKRLKRR